MAETSSTASDSAINSSLDSARDSTTASTQNTQTSQNLSGTQTAVSRTSQVLTNIKTKIFIYMGLLVVVTFFYGLGKALLNSWNHNEQGVGFFCLIIAICVYICAICVLVSAMETMWKRAKSKILKDNVGLYIAMAILFNVGYGLILWLKDEGYRATSGNGAFFVALLGIVTLGCFIYNIILRYKIYKEVAYITNQPLFLVAFWLGVTILLLPIAVIVYIIAWIMAKEIRESTSAKEYKKINS